MLQPGRAVGAAVGRAAAAVPGLPGHGPPYRRRRPPPPSLPTAGGGSPRRLSYGTGSILQIFAPQIIVRETQKNNQRHGIFFLSTLSKKT